MRFSPNGLAALLVAATALIAAPPARAAEEAAELPADLPINRLQVLGTHNSYAAGVDRRVLDLVDRAMPSLDRAMAHQPEAVRRAFLLAHPNPVTMSQALGYSHPSLAAQLDLGVRALEIDVNADPDGGAYDHPAAYRILAGKGVTDLLPLDTVGMREPGLKVLHMADIDVRSHCTSFRLCLGQMKAWSDAHPRHVPIFVMIEAKVQAVPILPGASAVPAFTEATYDEIDRSILAVIGRNALITPDDVRGGAPTLEQAVLAGHWPALGAARGKFLFQLTTAVDVNGASAYLRGHPGLEGRMAFLQSLPGQPHAAFILDDNALARGSEIRDEVRRGYLVRTRADIETYEAMRNDHARADAAFASGAQQVSTDFEHAGNAYGTPYVVRVPGGGVARVAPR